MQIAIAVVSILLITLLVWNLNKLWAYQICPICAGVGLTWFGFLVAGFSGLEIDWFIPAILMGGSVVGGAYLLEKQVSPRQQFLFGKMIFIVIGFIAVYELMLQNWLIVIVAFLFLLLLIVYYVQFSNRRLTVEDKKKIKELEEKMKDCC